MYYECLFDVTRKSSETDLEIREITQSIDSWETNPKVDIKVGVIGGSNYKDEEASSN